MLTVEVYSTVIVLDYVSPIISVRFTPEENITVLGKANNNTVFTIFADVIYIGNINTMHYSMCKLFLGAGYNVLCEKPLMVNSRQCREVVELARSKGVFLMEVSATFFNEFLP